MSVTHSQVKEILLASRRAAAGHIENIKRAPTLTYELVQREVTGYIKCKFRLTDEDCAAEELDRLAEISLAKSVKVSPELVEEFDLARSCDGVSSKTAKLVLLFMALQRDLDIRFRPMDTAEAETLSDIGALVWEQLRQKQAAAATDAQAGSPQGTYAHP